MIKTALSSGIDYVLKKFENATIKEIKKPGGTSFFVKTIFGSLPRYNKDAANSFNARVSKIEETNSAKKDASLVEKLVERNKNTG